MTRTHDFDNAAELQAPKVPSKRQPYTVTQCGKFYVRLDRTSIKMVQVVVNELDKRYTGAVLLIFNYNRFYHKTVWYQLLPLLLLDAVPAGWKPKLPDPLPSRNHDRKRPVRGAGPYFAR